MGSTSSVEKQQEYSMNMRSEKCIPRSEMFIPKCGGPIPFTVLQKAAKASCKIEVNGCYGSGFFICFNVNPTKTLFGLMTNNHVINICNLQNGESFILHLHNNVNIEPVITNELLRFTCPLLDATFVEASDEVKKQLEDNDVIFLKQNDRININDKIYIMQYPGGGDLNFADGFLEAFWGFTILHKVSTERGSSGSMILNNRGLVEGIHRARWTEKKANIGVRIAYVLRAIKKVFNENLNLIPRYLNVTDIKELRILGLKPLNVENLFVSPSSTFVTALWFYRRLQDLN